MPMRGLALLLLLGCASALRVLVPGRSSLHPAAATRPPLFATVPAAFDKRVAMLHMAEDGGGADSTEDASPGAMDAAKDESKSDSAAASARRASSTQRSSQ